MQAVRIVGGIVGVVLVLGTWWLQGLEINPYRPIDRRPGGEVRQIDVPPMD
jgi:hypothetical protein